MIISCFQMIRFFMSSNLYLNSLRIQNSPQFHVKFDGCEGVLIENVYIDSPALSPNTDGIHVENTKSVGIYNSMISNGNTSPSFTCINVIIAWSEYCYYFYTCIVYAHTAQGPANIEAYKYVALINESTNLFVLLMITYIHLHTNIDNVWTLVK